MEDTYNLRSVNKLKGLIETKYGIKITKKGNSFIVFPSETLVHIRGSKILHDKVGEYGFYHFLKNNFENLLNSNKSFFAVVYDNPEITFLIPKDSLASIFKNDLITNESESPRWYFYIRKSIDNKYFIDFRKENVRPIDITDYLNKWNQIDDIGQIDKREVQYFLVQVNRPGSENIINFNKYEHYNWQDTPRDIYHGQVKEGDKLLVYFASNSINYKKQLKKIYRVKQVSEKNEYFDLIEEMELNGLTLNDIKNGTQNGKLRKEVFDKLSQRGFNIIKIDKSDYDSVISLDKESIKQVAVFLTGYSNGNVQTSKQHKILGWKINSKISIGDRVFVYNKTSKKIECGFITTSKSNREEAIWKDEKTSNSHTKKYKYRWDADLVCDNLNIGLNTISQIDPFKKTENAKNASFGILVGGNNPKSITKPIYKPFRDYLLDKCNQNKVVLKAENDKWSFDINTSVKEILLPDDKDELAIKEELVVRILNHLKSEKHVILVGPPGVGKTDLARRILRIIGKKVINDENFLRSVASDEWSRFEVIGGINLQNKFQEGWITKAVLDKKWLLIDEFNRANMNKAFGEMFLGIEYSRIDFRPSEKEVLGNDYIEIDKDFRMICTMNDFDKNLLLSELSYGLISRFAFVSITPDITKEPKIIQRKMETLYKDISYEDYTDQIKTYFNFINKVREQRNIGVRTSIDVIKYLITSSKNNSAKQTQWILLNDALCDYVLPQFDRLDGKTINHVLAGANQYLQNNAFDNFKKELDKILDNLQKAAGWLDKNAY